MDDHTVSAEQAAIEAGRAAAQLDFVGMLMHAFGGALARPSLRARLLSSTALSPVG